jgi:glycosyltransferase involved in cell wall biosynthesis
VIERRPVVVIVATDPPWPPTSGGDLRIAAIASALASHAAVIPVVFPLRKRVAADRLPTGTIVHPHHLPGRWRRAALRAVGLATGRHPFLEHLVRTGAPDQLAADLARIGPDAVVLTYPLTGAFLPLAHAAGAGLAFDLDTSHRLVDRRQLANSRGTGRVRSLLDLLVAGRMEAGLEDCADEVWVSSDVSARDLASRIRVPLRLIPNTVEVDRYAGYRRPLVPGTCTFVGSFDYGPNVTAAVRLVDRILPILRRAWPDASLRLVGRNPTEAIRRRAGAAGIELFGDAEDVWALLAGHGPLVVPLTAGGGTRLKIIEAIACGIPVVGTPIAFEGLDLVPERHVLIADRDDDLASAIVRTWQDPAGSAVRSGDALGVVTAAYDTRVLGPALGEAIRQLGPRPPVPSGSPRPDDAASNDPTADGAGRTGPRT